MTRPNVDMPKLRRLQLDLEVKGGTRRALADTIRRETAPEFRLPGDAPREVDHTYVNDLRARHDALAAEINELAVLVAACERYAEGR